jgi:predicted amidohydrolase
VADFNIAVVQPHTNPPPDDERNVADAVKWIERAAGEGADFVCFPESYPGPWRMPAPYDPTARIVAAAAEFGVHVIFGTLEPIDEEKRTAYNLTCMAYPDGRPPARYRRTHPNGPWIYSSRTGGGGVWEFEWTPGDEFHVFDTAHGKVGLGMCSEVYMPEVSRALALRGAEIIFLPAGLPGSGNLWDTWHTLLQARAIENLALVVSTRNILDPATERGLAIIAGPERTLFESINVGMSVVRVSLDRVRALREGWDGDNQTPYCGVKQGLLSPQWQRPELYDAILPRSLPKAAE